MDFVGARANWITTPSLIYSTSPLFGDNIRLGAFSNLSVRLLALVPIVSIINYCLLCLRLSKAQAFGIFAEFVLDLIGAGTDRIPTVSGLPSSNRSLLLSDQSRRRALTSLSLRLLALVSVVTVIDDFLFFFRLTKADPLNILAKFFVDLVRARTECVTFSCLITPCN